VKAILRRVEADVLAFRDAMEDLAPSRCDASTLADCSESNYNDCSSTYPNQRCMAADELMHPACSAGNGSGGGGGGGTSCNALYSPSDTAVRIPASLAAGPNGNPVDPGAIEGVCYSRLAEPYMIDNYERDRRQMYFGSASGSFRIVPARHSEVCGDYDCRRRPWFVAASSGPKDVVLVVDVSGSMDDYNRMDMAREAAITIVDTLTVADRFAIVAFSDEAEQVGGEGRLVRATERNKERAIAMIRELEPDGATNFYAAFDAAFDAIDLTIRTEATSGCNVAVLFLTDGAITVGPKEEEVIDMVNRRVSDIATEHDQKTTIFAFSLGDKADHNVTKRIACSTNGIWTPVDDFDDDLVSAMSSYYRLYALGLGEGGNEDWVAWVEPYRFHTAGMMGTSASAPVYDRSVTPPEFLGVATVDMWMDDLEEILGVDATSSTMLDRFVTLSTARCPAIELTECEIDALRYAGGGEEAMCGDCYPAAAAKGYEGILLDACLQNRELPENYWNNTDVLGKDFSERACCEIGGDIPSSVCPLGEEDGVVLNNVDNGNWILIVQLVLSIVAVIGFTFCLAKRDAIMAKLHRTQPTLSRGNTDAETEPGIEISHATTSQNVASKTDYGMLRQHSIDPPAVEQARAQAVTLSRDTKRGFSIDPPADQTIIDQAEMAHSLSSTISQSMDQVVASVSPTNPDYNQRNASSFSGNVFSGDRNVSAEQEMLNRQPINTRENERAELARSLSSTITQNTAPVVASASLIDPDYSQGDAALSEIEARLENYSR